MSEREIPGTTVQSCDHHPVGGLIPSTRSRARMLRQLWAARELAEAFVHLVGDDDLEVRFTADGWPLSAPTLTVDLQRFRLAWAAYLRWQRVEPTADDLDFPPVDPPAEIRVPPEG